MNEPKYLQIKNHLAAEAMRPGSTARIPSVRQLMKQFGVSLATVNRALQELENEQIIVRRHGIGISINRKSLAVNSTSSNDASSAPPIVLAYTDYPDEGIWNKVYLMEKYCREKNIRFVSYKISQATTVPEIVEFIKSLPACRGLVIKFGPNQLSSGDLRMLERLAVPVVFFESAFLYESAPVNVSVLMPDPVATGTLLAETLLRNGHRKIGFIRNEPRNEVDEVLIKSIAWRLKMGNVKFGAETIFSTGIKSWENSLDAAQSLVRNNIEAIREQGLTALIFSSAAGAFAGLQTLLRLGVRVPEEVSLISIGDRNFCKYTLPELTVIDVAFPDMCRQAVDIACGDVSPQPRQLHFPPGLIARESIKKI